MDSLFLHVHESTRAWSFSAKAFDKLRERGICSETGGPDDGDAEIGPVLTDDAREIVLEVFRDDAPEGLALDEPARVAWAVCRCPGDATRHTAE